MSEWCQNPKCPEKKNSNQIRGSKGAKYYQSNKANGYGNGNFCTLGCQTDWDNEYIDRAIDTLGVRIHEPVKINLDNAWEIRHEWNYDNNTRNSYWLLNRLQGVKHEITQQQAQTPEQLRGDSDWQTRPDSEAKPLAIQLGLAS